MKHDPVSQHLLDNYKNYYDENDDKENETQWREMGAIDKVNNIISLCCNYPHKSVIEIGAGEGSVLQRLSEQNFAEELYALDISESGVKTIQSREISLLKECKVYDGYNIPYEDNQFDLAVLTHVVEHLENPRQLIYEASRIAKCLFVEVPLEHTISLPQNFVFDRVGHINAYSPTTIRRLLQSCKLDVKNQIITNNSKQIHVFSGGKTGVVKYYIKEISLRFLPEIATNLFTYHSALICNKNA
jgi:ubiquinone/menaquinone biosynthesis C-methylase UbiE